MTARVVLFAKQPVAGRVKSRLAKGLGTARATGFYRNTTRIICHRLSRDPRWQLVLARTPDHWLPGPPVFPPGLRSTPQGPGDIGDRMARLARRFSDGPVILVGSDIPTLQAGHITSALRCLKSADIVFGPATDGGFWLVGYSARAARHARFGKIAWSTGTVLKDCLAGLGTTRVSLLPPQSDIDDVGDYRAWRTSGKMLFQPRHQFDQIAGPVPAVELIAKDIIPAVLAGPGGTGQGKQISPVRDTAGGP